MHYAELPLVIDQQIAIALDPLVLRDVVRNLQDTHFLAFAMREPRGQKPRGEQTSHRVVREYQQRRSA